MCARITLPKSEIKIDFNDIYAVQVEQMPHSQDELPILHIYQFPKKDVKTKNCCGCETNTTEQKRVLEKTSLLASSLEVAHEWRRRLLWALENKMFNDDQDP